MINVKYSTLLLISGEHGGIWNASVEIRLIWQLYQCLSGLYIWVSPPCLWLTHTQMNIAPSCLCLCRIFLARPSLLWERWLDRWAVARRSLSGECVCLWPPACQYFGNCLANVDGWPLEVDVRPSCQGCFLCRVWNRISLSIFVLWFSFHIILYACIQNCLPWSVNAQKGLISDCLGNQ